MSTVQFRIGRDGHYAGVGEHTVLVTRHPRGFIVTLDGYPLPGAPCGWAAALRRAQHAAQQVRAGNITHPGGVPDTTRADARSTPPTPGGATTDQEVEMPSKKNTDAPADPKAAVRAAAAAKAAETRRRNAAEKKAAEEAAAAKAAARPAGHRDAILAGHDAGQSMREIAESLGISSTRVRQVLLIAGRIKVRPTSANAARDAEIADRLDAGESLAEVAAAYGLKAARVRSIYQYTRAPHAVA